MMWRRTKHARPLPLSVSPTRKGQVKEYVAEDAKPEAISAGTWRSMDCIDCHTTVGHPIAPTAELAVDRAITANQIDGQLPFARREAVRLVKAGYPARRKDCQPSNASCRASMARAVRSINRRSHGR